MNELEARTLREAHTAYVQRISRVSVGRLRILYREELAEQGRTVLHGGPASKDELVSAIVGLRYPLAKLNESVHVLYHQEGVVNEICAWCNPHPCPACGALEDCAYDSVHGPVVNGRHLSV